MVNFTVSRAQPQWLTLPPTPELPMPNHCGYAPINGVRIWYAVFGSGRVVVLLHGGLANSNYWGKQIEALAQKYSVIVMDARGHGRSTRDSQSFTYDLITSDVIGLMDFLGVDKPAVVGWSDGAIVGLNIAVHHPSRLSKLFAFAANSDPTGLNDISNSSIFNQFLARSQKEYQVLSPTPDEYDAFLAQIGPMWDTEPHFTIAQLRSIIAPVWIVDGDRDEVIRRENTEFMAAQIPNAGLLIQPDVSHFSLIQDPMQFNEDLLHFLRHSRKYSTRNVAADASNKDFPGRRGG